jgi:hypothetical protein
VEEKCDVIYGTPTSRESILQWGTK